MHLQKMYAKRQKPDTKPEDAMCMTLQKTKGTTCKSVARVVGERFSARVQEWTLQGDKTFYEHSYRRWPHECIHFKTHQYLILMIFILYKLYLNKNFNIWGIWISIIIIIITMPVEV